MFLIIQLFIIHSDAIHTKLHYFSLEPTPKNIPLTPCSLELTHKNMSRTLCDIQNKSINHFSPNVPIYCQLLSIHCTENTHLKAELTKILTQIY